MRVTVNGRPCDVRAATLTELIESLAGSTRGSAVVVDGEVVPRSAWPTYGLRDGQNVEVITAVQGG